MNYSRVNAVESAAKYEICELNWHLTIQYQYADVELTLIGNTGDGVIDPTDLEFHPDLSLNELWVISRGTESSGSKTVTFYNTGEGSQTSLDKEDDNNWHFMSLTTGLAFSADNTNFATSPGVFDSNHDGGTPFTGPALWSSDMAIYGEPSGGNGSHLDMLHESSYCQGIAWETENAFWVNDGYQSEIVRYDFVADHGPGASWHEDGIIYRYGGLDLMKDADDNVVSHLVLDHATGWLYAVDFGNDRVIRLDINSGTIGGAPSYGPHETLDELKEVNGFTWEEVITTGLEEPAGIALINNKLLVSDHATGDIVVYTTDGAAPFTEWFRIVTGDPGIMGLEIGPDGRIFYVNESNNKVQRIDAPTLGLPYESETASSFVVYPNPANDDLTLSWNDDQSAHFIIYDAVGKAILEMAVTNNQHIDLSEIASGSYFYTVNFEDGTKTSNKLIVK